MNTTSELIVATSPRPHVRLLTLNRGTKRNALSNALIAELARECRKAAAEAEVRCVVLYGSDTFFSAGADIKEMQQRGFEAIDNAARRCPYSTQGMTTQNDL